jgi:hypothetical protein
MKHDSVVASQGIEDAFSSCKAAFSEFVLLAEALTAIERGTNGPNQLSTNNYLTLKSVQQSQYSASNLSLHALQNYSALNDNTLHARSILQTAHTHISAKILSRRKEAKALSIWSSDAKFIAVDKFKTPVALLGRGFSCTNGDLVCVDCHFNHAAPFGNFSLYGNNRFTLAHDLLSVTNNNCDSLKVSLIDLSNGQEIYGLTLHELLMSDTTGSAFSSGLAFRYFALLSREIFRKIYSESTDKATLTTTWERSSQYHSKRRSVNGKYIIEAKNNKIIIAIDTNMGIVIELVENAVQQTSSYQNSGKSPMQLLLHVCLFDAVRLVLQHSNGGGVDFQILNTWTNSFNFFSNVDVLMQCFTKFQQSMVALEQFSLMGVRTDQHDIFSNLQYELKNSLFVIKSQSYAIDIEIDAMTFKVRSHLNGEHNRITGDDKESSPEVCAANQLFNYLQSVGSKLYTKGNFCRISSFSPNSIYVSQFFIDMS